MVHINDLISRAAEIIRGGGVAAFPTETVYGLGANALDEKAVAKIFEIKRRPFFDPLILHIAEAERLGDLATNVPAAAKTLIDKFWPGPLTLVLPKKAIVPNIATAGLPGVAVRVPGSDIARRLIEAAGSPVAAPSANLFGSVSPTTAEHVREQLGPAIDIIIDGGPCAVGVESTIVSFMTDTPTLLRPGGAPPEEIEAVIGKIAIPGRGELLHHAPGRCESHYATAAPIVLADDVDGINISDFNIGLNKSDDDIKAGLLTFAPVDKQNLPSNITHVECLSNDGDLREAACNLFAAMRRLDASGVDAIIALPVPNTGLGLAINDRLYRASRKRT